VSALKPCPFCGGDLEITKHSPVWGNTPNWRISEAGRAALARAQDEVDRT
jgi:hypothetical protein